MSSPTQTIDDLLLSECEATPEVPEDFANVLRAFFPRAAHLVNTLVFPDQSLANINIGSHIIAVTQEGHAEWRSRSPDTTTQILASRENLNPASLNWVAPKILAIANKTFRDAVHPDNLLPDLQAARNAALDMCTPRMVVEEALEHQPDLPWRPHKNRPNTYFVTLPIRPHHLRPPIPRLEGRPLARSNPKTHHPSNSRPRTRPPPYQTSSSPKPHTSTTPGCTNG